MLNKNFKINTVMEEVVSIDEDTLEGDYPPEGVRGEQAIQEGYQNMGAGQPVRLCSLLHHLQREPRHHERGAGH